MKIYLSTFVVFFELPYAGVDTHVCVCVCVHVRVFVVIADSFLCTCHNLFTCSFFNFFVFELQKKKEAPQKHCGITNTNTYMRTYTQRAGTVIGESVSNMLITCFYHLNHFIDEIRKHNGFLILQLLTYQHGYVGLKQ